MIADLKAAATKRGLKIHSGKTKILANSAGLSARREPDSFKIDGEKYEVLGLEEATKYLGRKVCYKDVHNTEFDNRVARAWAAFSKHKQELTDRRHRLKQRLKLFDAVVTSTLLYGCETWTLRTDQQRRLKTVQRKMLRMVLNAKRRPAATESSDEPEADSIVSEVDELEPWNEYLKRTAQWTEEQLEKAGLHQWTAKWRQRKWSWASKVLGAEQDKWSTTATKWHPLLHSSRSCGRKQARPKVRRRERRSRSERGPACPQHGA